MSYVLIYQDPFDTIDTNRWDKLSQTVCTNVTEKETITTDPDNANNNVLMVDGDFDYTAGCRAGLRYKNPPSKPFKVVAKVRWSSTATSKATQIVFGKDANGNLYWAKIRGDGVYIQHVLESELGDTPATTDTSASGTYNDDTWYTMEVEVLEDNTVNVSINGTQVISYQLSVDITPEIELMTPEGGLSYFDDFELYATQTAAQPQELQLLSIGYVDETQVTEPHFTIIDYTQNVTVLKGQTFSVNATIKNDGTASGTATVRLKDYNGTIVSSTSITLNAGEQQTVTLGATAPNTTGTYNYTIEVYNNTTTNIDDSKTVTVNVTEQAVSGATTSNWIWIIILIIILLLLLIVMRRRI